MLEQYDYIIVGAGSSGCVIASRLSEDPSVNVLLVEAGPEPRSPWIKIPGAVSKIFNRGPYNWGYMSEPEPALGNRPIYWPRGKGLGGSSAVNGMVYLRGHPMDFDHWRQLGNVGWGWGDVVPLFRRAEKALCVSEGTEQYPFSRKFLTAAQDAGFRVDASFNSDTGDHQDAVGYLEYTIRKGRRQSAYEAFVAPVRNRRNLTVLTDAPVQRIILEDRRATGIAYVKDGQGQTARARREVILSGGAVNSPQLLMLSGIGPAGHLREMSLDVAVDQPAVGENLHDHSCTHLIYNVPPQYTINHRIQGLGLVGEVAKYFLARTGVLSLGTSQACLFAKVMTGAAHPDIQIATRPFSFVFDGGKLGIAKTPTATASVYQLRPESRGTITLRSPDPATDPVILANFFASPKDQVTVVAGVRLAERIMSGPQMRGFSPATPIPDKDEALLDFIRAVMGPVYHPVGTCRMGPDSGSVVDERLRVRGVDGLRVADGSIMPVIVSANINAACIMIGEKASDLIAQDKRT